MRKLNKRILAFALVAVMVLGTAMNALASSSYEVTDAAWWSGNAGAEIALSSTETSVVYTIDILSDVTDWGIEIYDSDEKYISAFSYAGCWYSGATGEDLTGTDEVTALSSLPQGTYTVVVTRDGADFTVVYYDTDGTTILATLTATNTDLGETAYTHFYAQYGSFDVFAAEVSTYEVTDAGWWAGNAGAEVALGSTETSVVYTIEILSDVTDWGIEVYDSDEKYISAFSYAGCWYSGATGDDLTGTADVTALSSLPQGTYTVVVTRDGADFTIVYYDTDGITVLATLTATNTDIGETAYTHFYAQYGSFSVSGIETPVSADDEEETTTEETTTEETTTEETTTEETTTEASEGESITYTATYDEEIASGDADDATFTTFASTKTGEITLSGDFKLSYSFINYSDLDGSSLASTSTDSPFYWNNFTVEMVSDGVYVDVRADNAGWLANAGSDDSITFDVDTTDFDWDSWLASMTAGQLCIVYIEKVGTTITFKIDTGIDYFFTATAEVAEYTDDSEITIYLIGEQCTLTDVYYEATQTITEEKTLTFSEVVPVTVSDVYDADMNPYNIDLDADYEGLSDEQLAELAELFAGDFSSEAIAVTVTNDDGTEYVFSDGEGVYLCFELSAEASYDSILFLYYTEDGWQVAESDYVDEDGRYYVYFSTFESGTPIVILAGNATTTVNNTSSTPSSSDPTSTDPATTTAAPTTSASPTTADISVWMYIVLLVGAAVVISVFAKKRVTE